MFDLIITSISPSRPSFGCKPADYSQQTLACKVAAAGKFDKVLKESAWLHYEYTLWMLAMVRGGMARLVSKTKLSS